MRYAVIIEKGPESYGTYVPDLPGCVAASKTREEVMNSFKKPSNFISKGFVKKADMFQNLPRPSSL